MEPVEICAGAGHDLIGGGEVGKEANLPGLRDRDGFTTMWQLGKEEIEQLNEGGRVELLVAQFPPPPVRMKVAGPPCPACQAEQNWNDQLKTWLCSEHEEETFDGPGLGLP